ncbi:MAG: hypothetical protein Q9165_005807 [Trypethelium subeluteriae]
MASEEERTNGDQSQGAETPAQQGGTQDEEPYSIFTVGQKKIFQGIAPTFVGSFSDSAGRRPAYMVCFIIYICANIGLAVQNHYAALLVLRMLQSSGSSGTVAISNAIAADIVTSTERGSYVGYATAGTIVAPALAPVIGGLLDQFVGWK